MIETIRAFKTSDGKIFEIGSEAASHQKRIDLVSKIITLLGGTNNDICPNDISFSNGEGYFIVLQENFDKANELVKKLLVLTGQEFYSITSRACSEDEYTAPVGRIFACLIQADNVIKRVGQPYFALHQAQIGSINYTKGESCEV